MKKRELTQAEAFKMLRDEIKSGKPPIYRVRKVKLSGIMKPEHFKGIRWDLGFSQAKIGDILHTSVRNIQAYEQGKRRIPGILSNNMVKMYNSPEFLALMTKENPENNISAKKHNDHNEINNILKQIQQLNKRIIKLERQRAA
jgi:DNA-binding transcriptional regulator YiaG